MWDVHVESLQNILGEFLASISVNFMGGESWWVSGICGLFGKS